MMRAFRFLLLPAVLHVLTACTSTPCDGIDRSSTLPPPPVLIAKLNRELYAPDVTVERLYRAHEWSILYVTTSRSEPGYLFYSADPLTSNLVYGWGGITRSDIDEGPDIRQQLRTEVPDIPENLLACFAWTVTTAWRERSASESQ